MEACKKALDKAKIQLMTRPDSAFFTTLCFSLIHRWNEKIDTACTDGRHIDFNPEFFMSLKAEEQLFLLLHETLHVAYLHIDSNRRGKRDPARWNIAADHAINLQLISKGYRMPQGGLADKAYEGMSTEQIYDLLPEDCTPPQMADLEFSGQCPEELHQHLQDILVRAAVQSSIQNDTPGTIPGEIQIYLDSLLKPKLPWNRILQKYINTMAKHDYSMRKPNRRFFPKYHLPSLHSEALMDLAIAVDTSGSVTDAEFLRFVSEVTGIFRMMRPSKLTLIQFDTALKAVDEITSLADLRNVNFTGRGGTLIAPVMEWAEQNKPQLLLVFSDGHFRFHTQEQRTRVVWLIHDNPKFAAPYGTTIHYHM